MLGELRTSKLPELVPNPFEYFNKICSKQKQNFRDIIFPIKKFWGQGENIGSVRKQSTNTNEGTGIKSFGTHGKGLVTRNTDHACEISNFWYTYMYHSKVINKVKVFGG
jgi:hypothetical protein